MRIARSSVAVADWPAGLLVQSCRLFLPQPRFSRRESDPLGWHSHTISLVSDPAVTTRHLFPHCSTPLGGIKLNTRTHPSIRVQQRFPSAPHRSAKPPNRAARLCLRHRQPAPPSPIARSLQRRCMVARHHAAGTITDRRTTHHAAHCNMEIDG